MRIGRTLAALLSFTLVAYGCSDADRPATPVAPSVYPSLAASGEMDSERAALNELTRAVALALQDSGLRQRVKNDLRESRYTVEHKLPFSDYLHGQSGGILLAKMAKESGKTRDELTALLGRVRPLEFYMPVDEHRESWTGGDDLVVASLLEDEDIPTVYTLPGDLRTVPAGAAPALPTLVLTSVETDFSDPLNMAEVKNTNDQGGQAIGTLAEDTERMDYSADITSTTEAPCIVCDPGGGSPPPAVYPAGVYLDAVTLNDTGEADLRGDPEIELFVIGPTFYPYNDGEKISCSGQGGTAGGKYFDQNTSTWRAPYWTVQGLILSKEEVEHYHDVYNAPYGVQLWEDDQDRCDIVYTGRSELEQLYDNLMSAKRATTILMSIVDPILNPVFGQVISLAPGTGYALRAAVAGVFQSDDDFLGNLVYTPGTEHPYTNGDEYVDAEIVKRHVDWITGSEGALYSNGTVTIRTVNQAHRSGGEGPS